MVVHPLLLGYFPGGGHWRGKVTLLGGGSGLGVE